MSEEVTRPMTQDTEIAEMFDHLCWFLCSTRESFAPPEEQASKTLADRDAEEVEQVRTIGYNYGALNGLDEVVAFFEMYGFDVEGRAEQYVEESDDNIDVPKTRGELKEMMADDE